MVSITTGMNGNVTDVSSAVSVESEVGTTEAEQGMHTNLYTTCPQARRAHCDFQYSDTPQCMEVDVIENKGNCMTQST